MWLHNVMASLMLPFLHEVVLKQKVLQPLWSSLGLLSLQSDSSILCGKNTKQSNLI